MVDRPQIAARVIGFARPDCKHCFGRGRMGWDAKYKDKAHVVPCRCVEWFDLEVIQESWKRDQERANAQVGSDSQTPASSDDHPVGGVESILPSS